jgi:hypothetical protein
MSDLGSQPREVWKQPSRLPAEGRPGSSENTSSCLFVACLALFAYVPLDWHSEPIFLNLNKGLFKIALKDKESRFITLFFRFEFQF